MDCPECNHVTAEYQRLEQQYAAAINRLYAEIATSVVSEYMKLRAAADQARIDAENARLKLEKHKGIHGKANWRARGLNQTGPGAANGAECRAPRT
jgi:hypothetical protein